MSGEIDYLTAKDSRNEPIILKGEEKYLLQDGVTFSDDRKELSGGFLLLTTYNLYWYSADDSSKPALKVPLCYMGDTRPSGGWFTNEKLRITLVNRDKQPPYANKLYHDILKIAVPPLPSYPEKIRLEFTTGGRDKFVAKLKDALSGKHWEQIGSGKEEISFVAGGKGGAAGIIGEIEKQKKQMATVISGSFADLDSLKTSAKKLVAIAEKIRGKLSQTEGGAVSKEVQELQAVMFDIGIGTPVTKEAAGKEYYTQLSRQLASFVKEAVNRSNGIMPAIDAYCLYSRARGTDLVSPEDFFISASMLPKLGVGVNFRTLGSKVWVFESESFNEKMQIDKILEHIKKAGSMSAEQIANKLGVNVLIAKESLAKAEEAGMICRDDSVEGLLYCDNPFKNYVRTK